MQQKTKPQPLFQRLRPWLCLLLCCALLLGLLPAGALATTGAAEAEPPETGSPEEMLQTSPPPHLILDGNFETYAPNTNLKNLTDDNKWYSVTDSGATGPSATVSSEQSYSGSQSTAVNVALNFEKQMNMNFYRYAYCPTAVTPSPNATSIAYDTVFQNISQRLTNTLPPAILCPICFGKGLLWRRG